MQNKTCRETIELLMDYLEKRLPPGEGAALDAHFSACKPCLDFVDSYRETPRLLRKATAAEMPSEVSERLAQFLKDKKERPTF